MYFVCCCTSVTPYCPHGFCHSHLITGQIKNIWALFQPYASAPCQAIIPRENLWETEKVHINYADNSLLFFPPFSPSVPSDLYILQWHKEAASSVHAQKQAPCVLRRMPRHSRGFLTPCCSQPLLTAAVHLPVTAGYMTNKRFLGSPTFQLSPIHFGMGPN